ncbi:MAG: hypothetical protein OHK0022_21820 [Roseiflexaceae bacterium]
MKKPLRGQNPLTQQIKLGPTIRESFDELEPVHLALDLSIAVWQRECSSDGCFVALQPHRKSLDFWNGRGVCLLKPGIEALNITLAHHPQERQPECIGHLHRRTGSQHRFDKRLFLGFQFCYWTHQEPSELSSGASSRRN